MLKDKFSALEMGAYRIVQIENEQLTRRRNRGLKRQLVFTSTGSGGGNVHRKLGRGGGRR
jgi:hypothetical protein